MKTRQLLGWALVAGMAASTLAGGAETRFVTGSRLPVRAQASASGDVLGHLVTNSEVRLIAGKDDWCEVESQVLERRGFCQCKYLAAKPLALAEIRKRLASSSLTPRERLDWESRAFWVEPSLKRWMDVGRSMAVVLLSPETRQKEISGAKPLRFKTPEFEAMKERLAAGIVAPPPEWLHFNAINTSGTFLKAAFKHLALPAVKPSYFGRGEVFALNGPPFPLEGAAHAAADLVETLSAFHQIPFRLRGDQPAYYAMHRPPVGESHIIRVNTAQEVIVGVWDVGAVTATFDGPARLNGITRYARPTGIDVEALAFDFGEGGSCLRGSLQAKLKSLRKMPPWKDTLLAWVGKPAVEGKATVRSRQWRGQDQYDKFTVDDIDLDGDGVADFSVWNGRYQPQVSAEGVWQAVFANVAGEWRLLAYDQDDDCT